MPSGGHPGAARCHSPPCAASEGGLWQLTYGLAAECGPHHIRINAIAPGQASVSAKDQRDLAAFCNVGAPSVTDLPIDRIAKAAEPSEIQRAALDELRETSRNAAATLKAQMCAR